MTNTTSSSALPHDATTALYLALTLVLLVARFLGEIAKKFNQPAVMGELIAGIILGKTCLYYISPSFYAYLFASNTKNASAFAGVTSVCVTLYMLVAGLEMNLKNALKRKRAAAAVGFFSMAVPFSLGFLFCFYFPQTFGIPQGQTNSNFALFTATAMAITALPVAAKTLRDLHLFRTDFGVVVMSAAVLDDILGWSLFAITLAVSAGTQNSNGLSVAANVSISVIYVITVLSAGALIVNKILPFIQGYLSYPAGELGFVCLFAFASSTFALWVGLHNTLGAFLVGVAIGNSSHFRAEMRDTLDTFVSFMLAPIFFGSVCINANFATDFDAGVVFSIFFLSCLGKLLGGFIGAKLTGSSIRESLAIAVCMNARGAMELILAQAALDAGIIDGRVFVALVFMAILTSIIPGPLLRRILHRPKTVSISSLIPRRGFNPNTPPSQMQEVIRNMAKALGYPELADQVIERELAKGEPVWDGLAVATALSNSVKKPLAALSVLESEIAWMPDEEEKSVKFVVLLLIPESKHTLEFDLMREASQLFASDKFREELLMAKTPTELQALFQIEKFRQGMAGHNTNVTPVIALKETGMLAVDMNEIINASPRPSNAAPELIFSAKALPTLSGSEPGDAKDGPIIEFKSRLPRRTASMSVRETIEEYIGALPSDGESDVPSSTGEEIIHRSPFNAMPSLNRTRSIPATPMSTIDEVQMKPAEATPSPTENTLTETTSFLAPISPKAPDAAVSPSSPRYDQKKAGEGADLTLT